MKTKILINKRALLVKLIALFTLTTFSQKLWPFSINQIIGVFIFIVVLWNFFPIITKRQIIILMTSFLCTAVTFVFTENMGQNASQAVYWLIGIWTLYLISKDEFNEKLYKSIFSLQRLIRFCVILGDLVILLSLTLRQSYRSTWGGRYFQGLCTSPHTLAAGCCLLLSLAVASIFTDQKKDDHPLRKFLLLVPGAIGILQSGARTFVIPLFALVVIFYRFCIKKLSLRVIIFPLGILGLLYAFLNSGIYEKMLFLGSANTNVISNGRVVFWLADLTAFMNSSAINKVLGNGFDFITRVNYATVGIAIGGHNDVITCLLAVGIIGTLLYVLSLFHVFKHLLGKKYGFTAILLIMYCLFPALINGFYGYVQLLLSFVVLTALFQHASGFEKKTGTKRRVA